ncbi:MAG: alkaline phosphatase family protein [Anaerolineales bacterium]|nr:alkaline phosphatase family protein [Anaerolineales bacterium]
MKKYTILFLCFLLTGCISTPNLWGDAALPIFIPTSTSTPTQTATTTASPTATITATVTQTLIPAITLTPTALSPLARIERVLIISYDGMRPDAIAAAPMPNLLALIEAGASAPTSALTIDYPATSPSHASMLSGLCMEDHGVIYNKYFKYMGYSKGVDIFDLAHAAGLKTVMIVSKDKMRQMAEPETTDVFEVRYGEPAVAREVVAQIQLGFDLMFVHFAGPDNRGHKYDWMSGEYMKVLREGDVALGQILAALDENDLREDTLIIITADHGGKGSNHIGLVIEDYRIPWIASGPGVIHKELTLPIYTMDTAATAAYALKLPLQPDWAGIPIYEIFGEPQLKVHDGYPCKT